MTGSRVCPAGLKARIESKSHSLTLNLKIESILGGYPAIGLTKLDRTWTYDDGDGALSYSALAGFVPSAMIATSSMSVGNAEAKTLASYQFSLEGVNIADVRAGAYNNAWYTAMLVDYEHPEDGHWILPNGHGVVGRFSVDERSLAFTIELTDLTKLLKQAVVSNWQRPCRAIFGSQPWGTGGGVIEEEYPCGKDTSAMWSAAKTVSAPGAEANLTFTSSGLGAAADTYKPGLVEWLTGDNAGRSEMVELQSGTGVITLKFPMAFPIESGDTFKIRAACTNVKDGNNGCKAHFASVSPVEWKLHYRGEPQTPVSDGEAVSTPGAQI